VKYRKHAQSGIHELLRRRGPMSVPAISAALEIPPRAASNALQGMKRKGSVILHGASHASKWEAVGPPVKDMRGRAEGCEIGRERGQRTWPLHLPKMWEARGLGVREYKPKPAAGCALDDCWPVSVHLRHWEKKVA
jgi:hypothetical protein